MKKFKKILKTALCITLICAMLVTSMGAYSLNNNENVNYKLKDSEMIGFMHDFGNYEKEFKLFTTIVYYEKVEMFSSYNNELSAILYEFYDINDNGVAYAIKDSATGSVVEFAKGLSPYSKYLPDYQQEVKEIEYMYYYDGPTLYSSNSTDQIARSKPIKFVEELDAQARASVSNQEKTKIQNLEYSVPNSRAMTYSANNILSGVGNVTASGGLYCTDAASANLIWYWKNQGYSRLTSEYQTLRDLGEYFLDNNPHDDGGVPVMTVQASWETFADLYYPNTFSTDVEFAGYQSNGLPNPLPFSAITSTINEGNPSMLTLIDYDDFSNINEEGSHAVVVTGYSVYYGNWTYIQDGWTSDQVMILYATTGDDNSAYYYCLNYMYN